jgi:hypothetical protein
MKIGITGTREGASKYQLHELRLLLRALKGTEFHHGDCTGVDVQAAKIARELGYKIVCYHPKSTETQGYFGGDVVHEPAGYLQRDRAIVDECDVLLVVPLHNEWQPKGGTWYTHDYAVKKGKPYNVIWPKEKI